jgi:phosphatidate cytidylyltransferase
MAAIHERLSFWAIVTVLLLATTLVAGTTGLVILFALASLQGLREFLTLTHTRRADHWALLAAFFVVLPLQYVLIQYDWYGMSSIMIPVYAFLGLPIVSVLRGDTTRFMERVAEVQWGLMTCVYCLSYVPALLMLQIEGYAQSPLALILFLGVVVQGAELLHEGVVRAVPFPAQSKSPAFEFTIVGALGAMIGAALCWFTPFNVAQAAGLGAVVAMLGLAGSLVMEAVRRDRGVEDWRRAERSDRHSPGLLTRLERIVFAAPVFFHLVRFWWTV